MTETFIKQPSSRKFISDEQEWNGQQTDRGADKHKKVMYVFKMIKYLMFIIIIQSWGKTGLAKNWLSVKKVILI